MNKLPDSILESCIIPLLPMRDAVETSLISRRWRHLWRHSVLTRRNLEFDYPNVFGSRPRKNDDLDKFVKEYMELYQGEKIDSLKVEQDDIFLPLISPGNLDDWVRFAIAKGVEEIQLLLEWSLFDHEHELIFPGASSTLKHLTLRECDLRPAPDFDGFNNLRSLSLSYVTVDQIFMAHLLSNCLLLESLTIEYCNGLAHLCIVGDRLSDLKLSQCPRIEISAPNLVSLEYSGDFPSINFVRTPPHLARIVTEVEKMHPAVLSCLTSFPELETLSLAHREECGELSQINSDLTFRNLKKLSLDLSHWNEYDNLDHLQSARDLLKAAPLLEEFILNDITFRDSDERNHPHETRNNVECSGSFTHDHLKRFELQWFKGNWYEIEFAIWILKNAAKLEILVINLAQPFYYVNSAAGWSKDRIFLQEKLEQVKTSGRIIIQSE
uniref:F-box/FBD/LRR-repeat protein At1g13570-like n=1 Tax=Fragaria vesca subsp. vesca TaxID=101020 RepID=UPI0005C8ACBC|nr:PREDICTED: F-box/FBD/LRR-repeat protein At1g13570-like [Fragaria vesca subsp. vesca]